MLASVCICTFRRPDGLAALLRGLAAQIDVAPFQIVVVENEVDGPGAQVLERLRDTLTPHVVTFGIEPRENIALARNRTIALAHGDFLACIDDDEVPEPQWLAELLRAQAQFAADAVFGPVQPRLPADVPKWVERGRFFERPRHATGSIVPRGQGATSNVLIRRAALADHVGPFAPEFGRSGGEDTVLFEELRDAGARLIWSDAAVVHDVVPTARCTASWLLKRAFRAGVVYNRQQIRRRGRVRGVWLASVGAITTFAALPLAVVSLLGGVHIAVWWLRKANAGIGRLVALSSFRHGRYADEVRAAT